MTVIRSPISPVIFSPLREPTALYKGGGADAVPQYAVVNRDGAVVVNRDGDVLVADPTPRTS